MITKDVVVGLGQIGKPILKLISKSTIVVGFDKNANLINKSKFEKYENIETRFMHLCIPFNKQFLKNTLTLYRKFLPKSIIIHSTIRPHTTKQIQHELPIPIIYSPVRGVHKRMLNDLKKYKKFFGVEKNAPNKEWATKTYSSLMRNSGVKTKKISNSTTLELSKVICDTSYLGWLINYSQISNIIAKQHGVDFDEMWLFADEIHQHLGNRPKMFPGYIGGHCVIPNLELINNQTLNLINELNNSYLKKTPNAKDIGKKYGSKLTR